MQIHELPDVTAIGSGGYFATDNGSQTTKIDYDALAKAIIEQYSASTLAGSAQSVKTALDGLMRKSLPTEIAPRTTIASNDDLNTYTTAGIYRCASATIAASLSNCPVSNVGFNLDVVQLYNTAFAYQRITASTGTGATAVVEVYERFINVIDSMYGTWKKAPTRAEVDALSTNLAGLKIVGKTLAVGGSVTFTSTTVVHYVVFVCGAGGQRCAIVVRGASATGYTIISDANGTSNITVSASGRNLTITSADTASAEAGVYAVVFSGTVS